MNRLAAAAVGALAGLTQPALAQGAVGLANPASEFCVKLGGRLEIRTGPGGQTGYCHLPDGRVVEEWTLFREANKAPAK